LILVEFEYDVCFKYVLTTWKVLLLVFWTSFVYSRPSGPELSFHNLPKSGESDSSDPKPTLQGCRRSSAGSESAAKHLITGKECEDEANTRYNFLDGSKIDPISVIWPF
jgi:hypothetical protein